MAPDERDRNFEKALARHLRYSAPAQGEPRLDSSALPCPDPEILAAYHDGSLSPGERNLWKQHVLACENCQLVLEHLATPLDVPAALAPDLVATSVATAASSPQPAVAAAVRQPSAPVSITRARKPYFRWLVPVGAVAAGLLAFAVIRESRLNLRESPRVDLAYDRQPVTTPPAASQTSPQPAETNSAPAAPPSKPAASNELDLKTASPRDKDQLSAAVNGATAGRLSQIEPLSDDEHRSRAQSSKQLPAPNASHGPALSLQQQQRQQQLPRAELAVPSPSVAEKKSDSQIAQLKDTGRDLASQLPPSPLPPPPPPVTLTPNQDAAFVENNSIAPPAKAKSPAAPTSSATATGATAAPAASPAPNARAAYSDSAAAISAATETVEVTANPSALSKLRSVVMQSPQTFTAPDGKSSWRVGPAGSLEFSPDNGASWKPQSSGVASDLLTGSAPASKVVWVVGSSGIILRTTDAGKHWIKIGSPTRSDLIGVRASDAFHATVWIVSDPKSGALQGFQTSDGGITWSTVPN